MSRLARPRETQLHRELCCVCGSGIVLRGGILYCEEGHLPKTMAELVYTGRVRARQFQHGKYPEGEPWKRAR